MLQTFEAVFELFDLKVRRLRNGNKLSLVFESGEDLETEKKLIEFRGCDVKAEITQDKEPQAKRDIVTISDNFEVFEIKCRRLRNGDKLQLVIEQLYTKEKELAAVKLRYHDCKVFFSRVQQELDLEDEEEESEEMTVI